ncbi:MAG: hypothetical protein U1C46_08360 [Bacteroidales bacterium]|nr:hypothetical protein [Bacteroidales bacterium]MDZ4204813.1 hypothetical protein [Bacteroidales bacterium]
MPQVSRLVFIVCMFFPALLAAQVKDTDLVQFTGLTVTGDSLRPVPFTHILIPRRNKATSSDYNGFFSFVARKSDSIVFSAVGFKKGHFVIPDTITTRRYSMIQMMTTDTILLTETVIYPWPTREQFREAFINNRVPDDDLIIANKNLAMLEMRDRARKMPMDGTQNYRNFMQQQTDRLYYYGQTPPIAIFNPFAWAQFFKAWKNGDFRKKD